MLQAVVGLLFAVFMVYALGRVFLDLVRGRALLLTGGRGPGPSRIVAGREARTLGWIFLALISLPVLAGLAIGLAQR